MLFLIEFRAGELLLFHNLSETVPSAVFPLDEGCRHFVRNNSSRPYTFEIQYRNKCLLLSAASEMEMTSWMTSLCDASLTGNLAQADRQSRPIACGILATEQDLFIFQTSSLNFPIASTALEMVSATMVSSFSKDSFCLIVSTFLITLYYAFFLKLFLDLRSNSYLSLFTTFCCINDASFLWYIFNCN